MSHSTACRIYQDGDCDCYVEPEPTQWELYDCVCGIDAPTREWQDRSNDGWRSNPVVWLKHWYGRPDRVCEMSTRVSPFLRAVCRVPGPTDKPIDKSP